MKTILILISIILLSGSASAPTPAQEDFVKYKFEIHGEIKNKQDQITNCYTKIKEKSDDARGNVYLEFNVNTDGKAERINIRQDSNAPFGPFADYPKLSECIIHVVSGITFSPPRFPGEIEYFFSQPFIFMEKD